MRVRLKELKNVIRRVILESDMSYDDFDIDDSNIVPGDDIEDEIMSFLEASLAETGDIDVAISMAQDSFPDVDPSVIESLADIVGESAFDEPVSGPPSMRPSIVNQHAGSIRTATRFN